jgi:hypothetical protein
MKESKKSKRIKLNSPEALRKAIELAEDFGPGTENLSMEVDETLYGEELDVPKMGEIPTKEQMENLKTGAEAMARHEDNEILKVLMGAEFDEESGLHVYQTTRKMTFEEALEQTNRENHEVLQRLADMGPVMEVNMTAESREKVWDGYILRGCKIVSFTAGGRRCDWPPHLSYTVHLKADHKQEIDNEPDDYRK